MNLSVPAEPGNAYLIAWPPRTGKTYSAAKWIADNPSKRYIWIVPSWGNLQDGDSGLAAAALRELKKWGVECYLAGGMARTCPAWQNERAHGSNTPTAMEHRRLSSHLCGPCEHETRAPFLARWIDHVRQPTDPDEGELVEPPRATGPFPLNEAYQRGICPAKLGMAEQLAVDYGTVVITTPLTFRAVVNQLARDEQSLVDWCEDLVIIWDEAHKDNMMLELQSPEEFEFPSNFSYDEAAAPLPSVLSQLPPELQTTRQTRLDDANHAGAGEADEVEGVLTRGDCAELVEAVGCLADHAWSIYKEVTGGELVAQPLLKAERGIIAGRSPEEMANKLRNDLASVELVGRMEEVRKHALANVAPKVEKFSRSDAGDLSAFLEVFGDSKTLLVLMRQGAHGSETAHAETIWTALHPRVALDPWARNAFELVNHTLAGLSGRIEASLTRLALSDERTENGERWFRFLSVMKAAFHGTLWVDYRANGTDFLRPKIAFSALDASIQRPDEGYPVVNPEYGPLVRALRGGASLIMLTATPGHFEETERFLRGHPLHIIEYDEDEPKPTAEFIVEPYSRSIRDSVTYEVGAGYTLTDETTRILEGILTETGTNVHIVARNRKEHAALKSFQSASEYPHLSAVTRNESQMHYFRDASSLGVSWQLDDEWDATGTTIIMLGPPYLPPTLWASLQGIASRMDGQGWTVETSRLWQTERMAMELFQTACRGVQVPRGDAPGVPGKVILLSGAHALETIKDYGETWNIDVRIRQGRRGRDLNDRGHSLGSMAVAGRSFSKATREVLSKHGPGKISNKILQETYGHHPTTAAKVIREAEGARLIRFVGTGGANGREKFYEIIDTDEEGEDLVS